MNSTRAIVFFDLDGTLIDVRKKYYESHRNACLALGIKPLGKVMYWKKKTSSIPERKIVKLDDQSFLQYEKIRVYNLERIDFLKLDSIISGTTDILTKLKKRGHKVYILTLRRNRENLIKQLDWLGLKKYFRKIISIPPSKDPSRTKANIMKLMIDKKQYKGIIVGDTGADILAGKKIGAITIAVLTGIRNNALLHSYEPDHIISAVSNMMDLNL